MSTAEPLTYAQRCERYARQRGWHYDEHRPSIGHLTPRQRRRAMRKERHAWPLYSRRAIDMPWDPRQEARRVYRAPAARREICCDTCPRTPTCEEEGDFLAGIGLGEPWGDDGYPEEPGYCVTPGCDCCGDGDD